MQACEGMRVLCRLCVAHSQVQHECQLLQRSALPEGLHSRSLPMKFVAHQVPEAHPKPQVSEPLEQRQKGRKIPLLRQMVSRALLRQTAFYIISQGLLTSEMGAAGRKSLGGTAVTLGHLLKILFI